MIQIRHFLLVTALLLGLVALSAARKHISPFEYLNLPQRDQFEEGFHQLVSKSLIRVDFVPASSMEIVCQALERAVADEQSEREHREICRQILDMSRDERNCSSNLLDIYQSAWAQMMANFGKGLGKFYTYLRNFGQQHFEYCAKQVVQLEVSTLVRPAGEAFERDFRELYGRTFGLMNADNNDNNNNNSNSNNVGGDSNLFELLAQLARLDLVRGQFDAERMLDVIKTWDTNSSWSETTNSIELASELMLSKCAPLLANRPLGVVLDVVGWTRCLGSGVECSDRLQLLAEFRRLCLAWTRPSTRQLVEANVRRQLPAASSYNHDDDAAARANCQARAEEAGGQ